MWNLEDYQHVWEDRESEQILKSIYAFMKKPEQERTLRETGVVFMHMKEIKFFQHLLEHEPREKVQHLVSKLTYQQYKDGDIIFKVGDEGTAYYIILSGHVRVLVPWGDQEEESVHYQQSMLTHEVGRLHPGQGFGELALIHHTPRTATIQACSKCHLAVLEKEDYEEILQSVDGKDLESFIETLQSCPMFSHWTRMSMCKISYYFKPMDYLRGHAVFKEGDPADDVFIVVEGDFLLTQTIQGRRTQGEFVIMGAGEILEDDEELYTKTCICTTQTGKMLKITRKNFYRNITNKESWEWHNRISKDQLAWHKTRGWKMKKYDARIGLPQKEYEEYNDTESPYFRNEELPKGLRYTSSDRDEEIGRYLSAAALDATSKKYHLEPKRKVKSKFKTPLARLQFSSCRVSPAQSPKGLRVVSPKGSPTLSPKRVPSPTPSEPAMLSFSFAPSQSPSPSSRQSPVLQNYANRSFMKQKSVKTYSIAGNDVEERVNQSFFQQYEVMQRELKPLKLPGIDYDDKKLDIPFEIVPSPRRLTKPRRRKQVELLKSVKVPGKTRMFCSRSRIN